MAKKAPKVVTGEYIVTVHMFRTQFKASGSTVADALGKLEIRNARGSTVLTVSHGEKEQTRILSVPMVSRLFSPNPTMRQYAVKNVALLFNL